MRKERDFQFDKKQEVIKFEIKARQMQQIRTVA